MNIVKLQVCVSFSNSHTAEHSEKVFSTFQVVINVSYTNKLFCDQRKFPILTQEDLFSTIEKFRAIDLDDKGWVEKQQALEAVSKDGDATYDVIVQFNTA